MTPSTVIPVHCLLTGARGGGESLLSHWDQLKSYSGLTAIVSLYGIASLLVVFLGPSLGYGMDTTIIIIVLLLLTWPIAIVVSSVRRKRQLRREESQTSEESAPAKRAKVAQHTKGAALRKRPPIASTVYDELSRGAEEVVGWLRRSRVNAQRHLSDSDPIYGLPWFLVAGLPQSGKSSLLLSSGLDFYSLPSQRRTEQNLIRPTRDVHWRVTDWCVLIDTAGRYQTEGPAGDEWTAVLETLKKYRRRRPIDGLIVTADAASLTSSSDQDVEQQAKLLRSKIDELHSEAETKFPVYLVFTHADNTPGFGDFFSIKDSAERSQVWGATIPLAQSEIAHARFDYEFDQLTDKLMGYRLLRLSTQENAQEQLNVFRFPLSFAECQRKVGLFASMLFRPNPFSQSPLFRGFYFTANPSTNARPAAPDSPYEQAAIARDGFFGSRLLADVLYRDKDIAAAMQTSHKNPDKVRNFFVAAGAASIAILLIALCVSFFNNVSLLRETRRVASAVAGYSKNTDAASTGPISRRELEDIDRLRVVVERLDSFDQEWPPYTVSLLHRFGLYSGRSLSPIARTIYFEALDRRFFSKTVAGLESDLRADRLPPDPRSGSGSQTGSAADKEKELERFYDKLRTYLMLSSKSDKAEPSFLVKQLEGYWMASVNPEDVPLALKQLEFYSESLGQSDSPHIRSDQSLIAVACTRLKTYPPTDRYYKRVIDEIAANTKAVTVDQIVSDNQNVLVSSGRVSGAFTLDGYSQMIQAIKDAPERIKQEEDWVCPDGQLGNEEINIDRLAQKYSEQHVQEWRRFLEETRVGDYDNLTDAAAKLSELSKDDSPLVQILDEVARQTDIARTNSSFWSRMNPFSSKGKDEYGIAVYVAEKFDPLIKFARGEGDKGGEQMDQYLTSLTEASRLVNEAAEGDWAEQTKRLLNADGIPKYENQVNQKLSMLRNESSASVGVAALLGQPLGNLKKTLVSLNVEQIDKDWQESLIPVLRNIENGYPFKPSTNESDVQSVNRIFKPRTGEFWVFVNQKLSAYVRRDGDRWTVVDNSRVRLSEGFIDYLNRAQQLTSALFSDPNGSGFGFSLKLDPSLSALVSVQVLGQQINSATPPGNLRWAPGGSAPFAQINVGSSPPKAYPGYWALYRLVEEGGGISRPSSDGSYALLWRVGGTKVDGKLYPQSPSNNPFNMRLFTELRAPDRIR